GVHRRDVEHRARAGGRGARERPVDVVAEAREELEHRRSPPGLLREGVDRQATGHPGEDLARRRQQHVRARRGRGGEGEHACCGGDEEVVPKSTSDATWSDPRMPGVGRAKPYWTYGEPAVWRPAPRAGRG